MRSTAMEIATEAKMAATGNSSQIAIQFDSRCTEADEGVSACV